MISLEKIDELAIDLPMNSRLPQNQIINRLAFDDHAINILSYGTEYHRHITFSHSTRRSRNTKNSFFVNGALHCRKMSWGLTEFKML
jgi:hypothetical protein